VLKIGDFSQLGRVSVRMLRHYDALGLLKPAEVDHLSGYRFYAVEQLPRLNRILALKDLGLSLEQISRLLQREELSAVELQGMLAMRQAELERELRDGQDRLSRVAARLRRIEREDEPSPYEVVLKEVAPQTVVSARTIVPELSDMPTYRCALYEDLYDWLDRCGVEPRMAAPELALYHVEEFVEENVDMEVAVVIGDQIPPKNAPAAPAPPGFGGLARPGVRELPAVPEAASVVHRGNLWDVPDAVSALFAWAGENGYASAGPYREIHLFWRENEIAEEPNGLRSVVLEMQLPVEKAAFAGA
jgi:DNA-binding transcriptional MerR regulator/effector-binding domain-containing protein